jgi:predicted ATPase with chaperone activity
MPVGFQVAVSDAIKRRLDLYSDERYLSFTAAVANVVKGRAQGRKVNRSVWNGRDMYALQQDGYTLYYSLDPARGWESLVIEEHLSDEEGELIFDVFGEGRD